MAPLPGADEEGRIRLWHVRRDHDRQRPDTLDLTPGVLERTCKRPCTLWIAQRDSHERFIVSSRQRLDWRSG
jgi:hypothetical protein